MNEGEIERERERERKVQSSGTAQSINAEIQSGHSNKLCFYERPFQKVIQIKQDLGTKNDCL